MDENTVRIAVIETELHALKEQQKILVAKIEALTEVMNKGKGAFAFALFSSGTLGAGIATLAGHFLKG